jgi:hypothetical protein
MWGEHSGGMHRLVETQNPTSIPLAIENVLNILSVLRAEVMQSSLKTE